MAPTEFEFFGKLPFDTRWRIWTLILMIPQVIELSLSSPSRRRPQPDDQHHWNHIDSYTRNVPSILHVCRESRSIALKHYILGFNIKMGYAPKRYGQQEEVEVDFDMDEKHLNKRLYGCNIEGRTKIQIDSQYWNPVTDLVHVRELSTLQEHRSEQCQKDHGYLQFRLDKRLLYLVIDADLLYSTYYYTEKPIAICLVPCVKNIFVIVDWTSLQSMKKRGTLWNGLSERKHPYWASGPDSDREGRLNDFKLWFEEFWRENRMMESIPQSEPNHSRWKSVEFIAVESMAKAVRCVELKSQVIMKGSSTPDSLPLFPKFGLLPLELQKDIWDLSISPSAQIFTLTIECFWPKTEIMPPRSPILPILGKIYPSRPVSTIFHVCHESRMVALSHFQQGMKISQSWSTSPGRGTNRRGYKPCRPTARLNERSRQLYWQPDSDVLSIKMTSLRHDSEGHQHGTICQAVGAQDERMLDDRTRYLALNYPINGLHNAVPAFVAIKTWIKRLPNLEVIFVIKENSFRKDIPEDIVDHVEREKFRQDLYTESTGTVRQSLEGFVDETNGKLHDGTPRPKNVKLVVVPNEDSIVSFLAGGLFIF